MLTGSQGYPLKLHYGIPQAYVLLSVPSIQTDSFVFNAAFVLSVKGMYFIMWSVMADRMRTLFYPIGENVHYSKAI